MSRGRRPPVAGADSLQGSPDPRRPFDARWWAAVRKGIVFSGTAGGLFGAVFSVLITRSEWNPGLPILVAIPFLCAFVSGMAGIGGALVDGYLVRRGVENAVLRRVLTFLAVSAAVFGPLALFLARYGDTSVQSQFVWGVLPGAAFGIIVSIIEYRVWKTRQRMQALEMENRYLAEIADRDSKLEAATRNLLLSEERTRMARDLHDSVSQGIHGIMYGLHSLRSSLHEDLADAKVSRVLDHLDATAKATLDELRAMILELKPALLEDRGLAEAMRLHCELFSHRQGIDVNLRVQDPGLLSPEQQVAAYRITQEALTNVLKHSAATSVSVSLAPDGDGVTLSIKDNGRGFDADNVAKGNGLANMEARCVRNGGEFNVTSSPGTGTEVRARFERVSP